MFFIPKCTFNAHVPLQYYIFYTSITYFICLIALIPDTTLNLMGNFVVYTKIIRFELKRDEMMWSNNGLVRDGIIQKNPSSVRQMKICKQKCNKCWSKNECFGNQVNRKRYNENNNKPTPYLFACINIFSSLLYIGRVLYFGFFFYSIHRIFFFFVITEKFIKEFK